MIGFFDAGGVFRIGVDAQRVAKIVFRNDDTRGNSALRIEAYNQSLKFGADLPALGLALALNDVVIRNK